MPLLTDRPHSRYVDFLTSRFVVSRDLGLNLGDKKLEMGDEIPAGALSTRALRLEYDAFHIDLLSYAQTVPALREACARRAEPPKEETVEPSRVPVPVKPTFPKRR